MVKSGRLLADPVVEDLVICGMPTEGSLPPHQVSEITKQYKESVSEYAAIYLLSMQILPKERPTIERNLYSPSRKYGIHSEGLSIVLSVNCWLGPQ